MNRERPLIRLSQGFVGDFKTFRIFFIRFFIYSPMPQVVRAFIKLDEWIVEDQMKTCSPMCIIYWCCIL